MGQTANDSNPFWNFSLAVYGQPGVERLCLELQDRHGINVNLLLWSCWLETLGVPLNSRRLEEALDLVGQWDREVVWPLRRARRAIRGGGWEAPAGTLLESCKRLELEAEKVQQHWLYRLADGYRQSDEVAQTGVVAGDNIEKLLCEAGVEDHQSAIELLLEGVRAVGYR